MNDTPSPLAVGLALFAGLEAAGIRHCHWKHNDRLATALAGETALDLLVDADRAADADRVLLDLGFRRFRAAAWGRFPGLFDWIGFDAATGRLLHVHLYHQLLTGRQHVKEHGLPWAHVVLDARVRHPRFAVYVTHPALELVILLIRTAFKVAETGLPGRQRPVPAETQRAFEALLSGVDLRDVELWAHQVLPPADAVAVLGILLSRRHLAPAALSEVRRRAAAALARHRRMPALVAAVRSPLNAARFALARAARGLVPDLHLAKRLEPAGVLVAVIGADGAGKSTIAAELARWLAWKVDARTLYLGVGEGPGGLRVRTLRRLSRSAARPGPALLRDVGAGVLHNAMADERIAKLRRAARFRARGGVLLTDRFPQTQFPGIYDGPRTTRSDHDSVLRRAFARREAALYHEMAEMAPEVVIKLHVPPAVAIERKPGHDPRAIQRKCDLTVALQFPRSAVFDVDAARPLDEVLLDCKRLLWAHL